MKSLHALVTTLVSFCAFLTITAAAQTWTPLTHEPPVSVGAMLLLTDGRVLVHEEPNCSGSGCVSTTNAYNNWYTLTPDSTGSYINGTWAQVASTATTPTNYAPLFFSSAVLPDGKVAIQGGEYNCPSASCADAWQSNGALYDPVANTWTALTPEITSSWEADGDAQSVVLPNGTWMTAACCAVASGHSTFPEYYYFNESSLNFTNEASASDGETTEFDESGWNLMPNGEVLMVNVYLGAYNATADGYAIYNPSTNTWTEYSSTGVQLWDSGCGNSSKASYELGPLMLMPNGTYFATGASECEAGKIATYNWSTNTWTSQGTFPNSDAANDAPGATEINGNAIVVTSPYTNTFSSPITIYEWNGTTLSTFPNVSRASSDSSYVTHLLVLPTGQIMFTDFSTTVEILTSAGTYESAWQPTITSAPFTLTAGQTYSISGTQFNGVTTGASYGDDFQDNTNYPLVRIVNNSTGNVYYARTHGHSTMGVATGSTVVSTNFDVPSGMPSGPCELYVVANGIPSAESACEVGSGTVTTTGLSSSANPSTYGASVTFTATITPVNSPAPTGTVAFTAGGTSISGCSAVTVSSAEAQCSTSALAGGSNSIVATYSGDTNYDSSTGSLTQTVSAASQTISCTGVPSSAAYNSNFTVSCSATSGLAVAYTSSGGCTNSGETYTMTSGTTACSVIANQAGNADYSAAPTYTNSVSATPASQTITFTTNAPSSAAYTSHFTVAATASSGLAVAYTSSGVCTNSGTTYTMTSGTGSCSVIANQAGNTNYSAAPTDTQTVTATLATNTVTFTTAPPASAAYNSNFTVAASGKGTGAITYTSNGGCTNTGATYTMTSGTTACSVMATQAADSNYGSASVSGSVTATKASQTISFTTPAPASAEYGSSFTVAATATSGLAVAYTSSGSCTNSGATYTMTSSTGNCSVIANQAGNTNYSAAAQVAETTSAADANGSVAVSSSSNPSIQGQSVTFTATITSDTGEVKGRTTRRPKVVTGTVAWSSNTGCGTTSVTSGYPGTATCTTSSLEVGTDTITAAYSGDSNHNAATGTLSGGQVVNSAQSATSTSVGSTLDPSVYGQAVSFTASVTSSNGTPNGTVQFTVDGNNFGSAVTLSGGSATSGSTSTLAVGNHTVTAVYSGSSSYTGSTGTLSGGQTVNAATAGTVVTSSVNPSSYGQSVTFTATINGEYGLVKGRATTKNPRTVTGTVAWSSNTGCGTTAVASGNPGTATCTTSSLGVGSDTVTGTYSGDANHSGSAGSFSQTVNQAANTVTFTTAAPASAEYGSSFTVAASGLGTGAISYTSGGACSNSGATYTMTAGTGTCTVTATQAADANYQSANASESVTAEPAQGSVSVSLTSGSNPSTYGNSITFTATVTSDTGAVKGRTTKRPRDLNGSVTWSGNTGCSASPVSGNPPQTATCTTSTLGAGGNTVTATYTASDSNHTTASGSVSQTVNQASQSITFTTPAPSSAAYNSNFTVAASASSGLAVAYTSAGACTNSGTTYTMTSGSGTCFVIANQAGNSNYTAATQVTESTTATPLSQTITVTTSAPANAANHSSFTVAATAQTAVAYSSSGACSNSGATYTITASSGTCSVIMNAPANSDYAAAPTVTEQTHVQAAVAPSVTFTGAPATALYGSSYTVTATSNSSSVPTITAPATAPCTVGAVSNNGPNSYQATVTMTKGSGMCTLTAKWAANYAYLAASATQKTTGEKIAPTVSFTGAPTSAGNGTQFTVTATSNESGAYAVQPTITATGSCTVGSVSGSEPTYTATVTVTKATGTCTMTAKWAASDGYAAASVIQHTTAN